MRGSGESLRVLLAESNRERDMYREALRRLGYAVEDIRPGGEEGGAHVSEVAQMRLAGWRVAIHNDYEQHGQRMTFWLFTHPDGRYVKCEGASDRVALEGCLDVVRAFEEEDA